MVRTTQGWIMRKFAFALELRWLRLPWTAVLFRVWSMSRPRFPCSLHRRLQHSHCTDLGCPASLNCYLMKEMSCWAMLDGRLCQKLHGYIMFIPFFDSIPFWIFVTVPTFTYCFFHRMDHNFTRLLWSFKNILSWWLVPCRFFTKTIQLWLCILCLLYASDDCFMCVYLINGWTFSPNIWTAAGELA